MLLTVTTGAVDAICFLMLGRVFGSVITGDMVLLGVAAATRTPDEAIQAGLALAGYAAGVLAAAMGMQSAAVRRLVVVSTAVSQRPPGDRVSRG